ncbi:MAG: tRNA uridine-5-carboxymethylaminomethyl(34) synthesis GTPase MnmE [Opitutus sp.]|nr:tRNA uridine-5-carboxymethylaminomethyl(34) synthesis GTPase MnmE [Opitutus sp.]
MAFPFASQEAVALRGAVNFSGDTIAALATPVGTSAIAVVRASGVSVAGLAREIFGETPPPRVAQHADYRAQGGELIDDVLFTFFAGPNSYTGEDTLEVSCHGNPFIAQKLVEDLLARGCRPAEPGEFTRRAFLNGRLDLSQAEAVMDLIHARSERALAAANQQLRGSLGRRMEGLISRLLHGLAQIEAQIDFPEEDLPPENRAAVLVEVESLRAAVAQLRATARYGEVLRTGVRTVIIGEPNAGKSSLLNRLVGRERALVSAEPGTTRDYLEEFLTVGPHVLRLVDTAGLNQNPTALERRGMEKTMEQAADADLFLWIIDATRPIPALPEVVQALLGAGNTLAVFNKVDLRPGFAPPALPYPALPVSALSGEGLARLSEVLIAAADAFRADSGEEIVAINARHGDALRRAAEALGRAATGLAEERPIELVASEMRECLACFGEICGRIDNEAMLDILFSSFCIGK